MDRNWTLHSEFARLKIEYGLFRLDFKISPEADCKGWYSTVSRTIHLRSSRRTTFNLFVLLHEMKHAIQFKKRCVGKRLFDTENDLAGRYFKSLKFCLEMELEADQFALSEYDRLYLPVLGKPISPQPCPVKRRNKIIAWWNKEKK